MKTERGGNKVYVSERHFCLQKPIKPELYRSLEKVVILDLEMTDLRP
jgi:hypothetical protein